MNDKPCPTCGRSWHHTQGICPVCGYAFTGYADDVWRQFLLLLAAVPFVMIGSLGVISILFVALEPYDRSTVLNLGIGSALLLIGFGAFFAITRLYHRVRHSADAEAG